MQLSIYVYIESHRMKGLHYTYPHKDASWWKHGTMIVSDSNTMVTNDYHSIYPKKIWYYHGAMCTIVFLC